MAESNPGLTEGSNQADSPAKTPLPYNWGKFQGWVMLIAGPFVELTRSGWLALITVPLMIASGYAFAFRKRYAVTMTYVWIVLYMAVSLLGFVSAVTNNSLPAEGRGYEIGRAIGTLLIGVGFWSLCAVYYHKRLAEFRLEAISKANKSNELSSKAHKQAGPNRRVEEVRVKESAAPEASMNRKQRVCLTVGFLLLVAATLIPPWRSSMGRGRFNSSYGFLFNPPYSADTIDLSRLLVEWLLIALVTGGPFHLLKGPDSPKPETAKGTVAIAGKDWLRRFWLLIALSPLITGLAITNYISIRKMRQLETRIHDVKRLVNTHRVCGSPVKDVLDPVQVPNSIKSAAWNAWYAAANRDDFIARFDKLNMPDETKADLWNLKYSPWSLKYAPAGYQTLLDILRSTPLSDYQRQQIWDAALNGTQASTQNTDEALRQIREDLEKVE